MISKFGYWIRQLFSDNSEMVRRFREVLFGSTMEDKVIFGIVLILVILVIVYEIVLSKKNKEIKNLRNKLNTLTKEAK
jgi:hypothetical protein